LNAHSSTHSGDAWGQVTQLVGTGEMEKKNPATNELSGKLKEAKQQAKQEWQSAMKLVRKLHKFHTIERHAVGQLPARPQYIDAGTLYYAELKDPLDFGTEPFTPEIAASMQTPPPKSIVACKTADSTKFFDHEQR
jgi:hypothetical protein